MKKKPEDKEKEIKIPSEVSQKILKQIVYNILKAIGLMIYFIILNMAYSSIRPEKLAEDIKVFAGAYLIIGLVMMEKSYKEEKNEYAITSIELLVISLHSLSIMHIITRFEYDFRYYLLTSSYIFSIYYILKSIIIYTKEKRDYLKGLSDISDIVKRESPIKKEAKKRNNNEIEKDVNKEKREEKDSSNKKEAKTNKTKKETQKDENKKEKNTILEKDNNKSKKVGLKKETNKSKKITSKKKNDKEEKIAFENENAKDEKIDLKKDIDKNKKEENVQKNETTEKQVEKEKKTTTRKKKISDENKKTTRKKKTNTSEEKTKKEVKEND